MTGYAPGVYGASVTGCAPDAGRSEEWTVEGVARCPGPCGLYFDIEAMTLPELENFIETHDCAKKDMRYMPWEI